VKEVTAAILCVSGCDAVVALYLVQQLGYGRVESDQVIDGQRFPPDRCKIGHVLALLPELSSRCGSAQPMVGMPPPTV
jgi:hypothetical protein